ncbi:MAG TPA: phospholipase D family protein, partial [Pyrinomonadaceae bacterium]|nr:phospholipase D family protein [Pyrinomonadaceae bacterium]
ELGAAWAVGPGQSDDGAWLSSFLERVASWCPGGLRHNVIQRALEVTWMQEARARTVDAPGPILTGYGDTTLASQLRRRWAGRRFDEVRIITGSTDESGTFLRWLHDQFGIERSRIILDQNRASFIQDRIDSLPVETRVMHLPGRQPTHAKFYWFDGPDGPAAVMGSANCSAAAWLLAPDEGGNIEAVTVYDKAEPSAFESILAVFDSESLTQAKLTDKPITRERDGSKEIHFPSEADWDAASGELHIGFTQALPHGATVTLEAGGQTISMRRADAAGRTWVTEVSELASEHETAFVNIIVRTAEGAESRYRRWVNDLSELRHSARGRRIADAISALGNNLNPSEQQRTLAQLQRLSVVLLTDPSAFKDPFARHPAKPEPDVEAGNQVYEPIDPEKFVRSIEDIEGITAEVREGHPTTYLSLAGVMRAIFSSRQVTDFDDEIDYADEMGDTDGGEDKQYVKRSDTTAKRRITLPDERYKQRLKDQIQRFINDMGQPGFTGRCTATQLVEASAYPLAVIFNGSSSGWVDDDQAQTWAVQVFDKLFSHGKTSRGLLDVVRARYRDGGKEEDFLRIVGDGTLWLALLSALANLPWKGWNAGLQKALALRSVFEASELMASSDGGRMRQLLSGLEEQRARSVIRLAPLAVDSLRKVEVVLKEGYRDLCALQEKEKLRFEAGDLLWKPEAVWAENKSDVTCGENTEAYLHLRAAVTRIKSSLFIDVTKAKLRDKTLAQMMREIESLGSKV